MLFPMISVIFYIVPYINYEQNNICDFLLVDSSLNVVRIGIPSINNVMGKTLLRSLLN